MIPVDQTIFSDKENGVHGNCQQAAFASILELPLEAVPHFAQCDDNHLEIQTWLAKFGLSYLEVPFDAEHLDWYCMFAGHYIVAGTSPRGLCHAVVAKDEQIVHDPHPSREGIVEKQYCGFFVLADHASYIKWIMSQQKEEQP